MSSHRHIVRALFLSILGFHLCTVGWAVSMYSITYEEPYRFAEKNGKLVIQGTVKGLEGRSGLQLTLGDQPLKHQTGAAGAVQVTLPLIGAAQTLVIRDGQAELGKQLFTPLIPQDWGYFKQGTIHIISSSHQDIAWMDTPEACRHERIHKIILPALDMMDQYPEFRFEMEQTLNLMEVWEDNPEERERILRTSKSGQFAWGATYTQPYEGLESGEQLIRQLTLGRKWIKENLPGVDAHAAYNIDVPGRSLQFPQMMHKGGVKYLFVSRMKEGFYRWASPDGSEIFTYSPGNYGWAIIFYKYFDKDAVTAMQKLHAVLKNWHDYYRERNIPPHYAVVISNDASGPVYYREVVEQWNQIAEQAGVEMPRLRHSTAEEFLAEVDVPEAKIDTIHGERPNLWLYIHGPGHYEAIKAKKEAAVSLPGAEMFATLRCMVEQDYSSYPQSALEEAWAQAILPDHGWGGKNGHITDEMFRQALVAGNEQGKALRAQALEAIGAHISAKQEDSIVVYNNLSWERTNLVSLKLPDTVPGKVSVTDGTGQSVPTQITSQDGGRTLTFQAADIPSIGYRSYRLTTNGVPPAAEPEVGSNYCENSFYRVVLGRGGIQRLYDKELKREILNETRFAGGDLLHLGYDGNGAGEFVQIKALNMAHYEKLSQFDNTWRCVESGPLYALFESRYTLRNCQVVQRIKVHHQSKQIDFSYDIPDWPGEHNRQLRVAFPLRMDKAQVTYDVPMGIVGVGQDELDRSPGGWGWSGTYRQIPQEINPREIQNFISASSKGWGATLATDLSVADWIDPTRESVDYPVLQGILFSTHKSCHGEGNWYEQKGSHSFRFSFTTHAPGWQKGFHFALAQNNPLLAIRRADPVVGTLPDSMSFIQVSSPWVWLTAFKRADDNNDIIMRLVDFSGHDQQVNVEFFQPLKRLSSANLIEESLKSIPLKKSTLQLHIGKFAIETYRMDFKP